MTTAPPTDDPVLLGDVELLEPLGRGGMGVVWSGRDGRTRQRVAVKLVHAGGEAAETLIHESRRMAGLHHPSIVEVLDVGVTDEAVAARIPALTAGTPYLVLTRAAGGSLSPWCGGLPWPIARHVLEATLEGLARAHAAGVVHLDLKPENVLLDGPPEVGIGVRLTDFGLCHALSDRSNERRRVAGTPAYMAPEQCAGSWRDLGPWTDLFGFGCLAWTVVCGDPPVTARGPREILAERLRGHRPPFRPLVPVPEGLESWLDELLATDAARRPRSAAEAAARLRALPDPLPGPGPVSPAVSAGAPRSDTFLLDELPPGLLAFGRRAPSTSAPRLPPRRPEEDLALLPALQGGVGVLAHRRPPVLGRGAAQDALWGALAEVVAGGGRRVDVVGGPGSGRTHLAAWIAEEAAAAGCADALWVREDGLLRALARHLAADGLSGPALAAQARRACGIRGVAPEPVSAALEGEGDAVAAIRALAAAHPLVLVLDGAELELPPVPRVLVVALRTRRPDAPGRARATVIDLPPLDDRAVGSLVDALVRLDPAARAAIRALAGGVPRVAVDVLVDAARRGELTDARRGLPTLRPGALDRVVAGLLPAWEARTAYAWATLGASDLAPARVAARIGARVPEAAWRRTCEALGARLGDLADRLVAAGAWEVVDGGWRFRDPFVRLVLLHRPEARARAAEEHRVLADTLPADHPDRGFHLLGAERPDEAAPLLFDLVHGLTDLAEVDRAIEAWRRARPTPTAAERVAIAAVEARAATAREDVPAVQRITAEALAVADPEDPARGVLLQVRARALRETGRWPEALALAEEAVRATTGPNQLRAEHTLALILRATGRLAEAEARLRSLVARGWEAPRLDLVNLLRDVGRLEEARAELRAVSQGPNTGSLLAVLSARGHLALRSGDLDEAEPCFLRSVREAARSGVSVLGAAFNLAGVYRARGRTARAATLLRGIVPRARVGDQPRLAVVATATLIVCAPDPRERAELLDELERDLRDGVPGSRDVAEALGTAAAEERARDREALADRLEALARAWGARVDAPAG